MNGHRQFRAQGVDNIGERLIKIYFISYSSPPGRNNIAARKGVLKGRDYLTATVTTFEVAVR